jgi:hypothetical protein
VVSFTPLLLYSQGRAPGTHWNIGSIEDGKFYYFFELLFTSNKGLSTMELAFILHL